MTANEWENKLRAEGFNHTFTWEDGPEAFYPEHTHAGTTAHVILSGEMTLTVQGETRTYKAGERCDVPAAQFTRPGWDRRGAGTLWVKSKRRPPLVGKK